VDGGIETGSERGDRHVACLYRNRLLNALPDATLERLSQHLAPVEFEEGQILLEPGLPMQQIFFPVSGLVSLALDGATDGQLPGAVKVGLVGRDGMVGTVSAPSADPAYSRAKVEIAGEGLSIPAPVLREEFSRCGELQNLILRHLQLQVIQASQVALCVHSHNLEARLCHWLLCIQDEVEQNTVRLSMTFFAHLLRAGYTETILAAAVLWKQGLIRFCHENVTILNRKGMEERACACYGVIQTELQQSFGIEHSRAAHLKEGEGLNEGTINA
jgi:CRP-like cAMP-binding protein